MSHSEVHPFFWGEEIDLPLTFLGCNNIRFPWQQLLSCPIFSPPQSSQEVLTASHPRSPSFSAPLLGGLLQIQSELGQLTFRVFWKSLRICPQRAWKPPVCLWSSLEGSSPHSCRMGSHSGEWCAHGSPLPPITLLVNCLPLSTLWQGLCLYWASQEGCDHAQSSAVRTGYGQWF